MQKTKAFCFAGLVLITAVITHADTPGKTNNSPSSKESVITIEGTTVIYAGKISEKRVDLLLNTVKGKKIETLIINSGGGEINAAMKMGHWVFDNSIDVVVDGICMSSSANYVFTAGRRKTIKNGSIVAWHGNALQKSGMSEKDIRESVIKAFNELPEDEKKKNLEDLVKESIEQMRGYMADSIKRQAAFFSKIGVDEYVCRIGNEEYGARDFFILSKEDMGRFGITNVTVPDNYGKTDLSIFRKKGKEIQHIRLTKEKKK